MEKSKLGVHVLLLAAGAWLLSYFGGYTILLLFAGYVLLMEENLWLKKQVLRVLSVMLCFSILDVVVDLLPNFIDLLDSIWSLFDESVYWEFLPKLIRVLNEIIYWVKLVIFMLGGLLALKGKTFKLPVIDKFLNKFAVQ